MEESRTQFPLLDRYTSTNQLARLTNSKRAVNFLLISTRLREDKEAEMQVQRRDGAPPLKEWYLPRPFQNGSWRPGFLTVGVSLVRQGIRGWSVKKEQSYGLGREPRRSLH